MKSSRVMAAMIMGATLAALVGGLWIHGAFAKGAVRDEGIRARLPQAAYAGSNACVPCHADKHARWVKSSKAGFVRLRCELESLPGDWTLAPFDADDVAVLVGFRRKVAFVDVDWKVFPYEYHLDKGEWKERPKWSGHDYRERCGTCHLTGLNVRTLLFREAGVGCEACHGPGALHVRNEAAADIRVPAAREGKSPAVCRRCHNDRDNHAKALTDWTGLYHR